MRGCTWLEKLDKITQPSLFLYSGKSGLVPEGYVELSNEPLTPNNTSTSSFPQAANDDWGNVFGTTSSFAPGKHFLKDHGRI